MDLSGISNDKIDTVPQKRCRFQTLRGLTFIQILPKLGFRSVP
jgi:hypothetical protein